MPIKNLYKGAIGYPHTTYIEYAYAYSKDQAKVIIAQRVAKKQGVLPVQVLCWMKEFPNNWQVDIEVEFEEVKC